MDLRILYKIMERAKDDSCFLIIPIDEPISLEEDLSIARAILKDIKDKEVHVKFRVIIEGHTEKVLDTLVSFLKEEQGFTMLAPLPLLNIFVTTGYKTIDANQLLDSITAIRESIKEFSCYLNDWKITSD